MILNLKVVLVDIEDIFRDSSLKGA